jgi:hypothetical protein
VGIRLREGCAVIRYLGVRRELSEGSETATLALQLSPSLCGGGNETHVQDRSSTVVTPPHVSKIGSTLRTPDA